MTIDPLWEISPTLPASGAGSRSAFYRHGFAKTKGPAVCPRGTAYRQEQVEGALLAKFREAMTAPMISGRAKSDSLLKDQEAVCLQMVAGAGYDECYTAPDTY